MEGQFVQLKQKLFAETSTITPNLVQSGQTEGNLVSSTAVFVKMYKIPKIIVEVQCKLVLVLETHPRLNTPLNGPSATFVKLQNKSCRAP